MKTRLLLILLTSLQSHAAVQLISNGDFEAGTFAGWTAQSLAGSNGNLSIDVPGTTTPFGGLSTASNPLGGNFYAVTSQTGPGSYSLTQTFTVSQPLISAMLGFQLFADNYAGVSTVNAGAGLNFNSGTNQHARVDLLTGTAGAFDMGGAILATFYLGSDSGPIPNPFTSYSINIASLISNPGSYQLRFAQVDNQGNFVMGVDNVGISAEVSAVPEPGNIVFLGALLSGGLLFRIRRLAVPSAAKLV